MATNLVIDASVVIAAVSPSETGHVEALEFPATSSRLARGVP
jgi:hypothetical protein